MHIMFVFDGLFQCCDPRSGAFFTLDPGSGAFFDPGSGAFLTLDPRSGIPVFPGSRIPDPKLSDPKNEKCLGKSTINLSVLAKKSFTYSKIKLFAI